MKDVINNLKNSDTWKVHSKSDKIEIIRDEADEVTKKLFDSLKNRYQNNLELMKGSEIKPFTNKCKCKGIHFRSEKDDWKIFGENNVIIALNVFYAKIEKNYPAYVSKHKT